MIDNRPWTRIDTCIFVALHALAAGYAIYSGSFA